MVVSAAPGAGKTTRVPPALLDTGVSDHRAIVVLEPRRIAARAAAEYVAAQRGEPPGWRVGYRVRQEHRGGADTRLWFVTEGIFTRQLAGDAFLESVGVVVIDEFHERHLQGDAALAVVSELQATVRPDLKLVVMSATLDTERLSAHLKCSVVRCEGRAYPVRITHAPQVDQRPLPLRVRSALAALLRDQDDGGDILVFLPGAGEIRRTAEAIEDVARERGIDIQILHGELALEAQRRVLERGGRRRVVLATNVAETALTVEGVTAVIDSGLARLARFDTRRGINHLEVRPISRAAAEQRAGRAGRTSPGRCVRLWTEAEHHGRRAQETPEISRLELSSIVLELRAWGLQEAGRLPWLDAPPDAALRQAERLLLQIGAIAENGSLTDIGRRLLQLPVPPRLGRILVEAERRGCAADAALLASLAAERDILAGSAPSILDRRRDREAARAAGPSDLLLRAELFEEARQRHFDAHSCRQAGLDRRRLQVVERTRRQLAASVRSWQSPGRGQEDLLRCILAGFADRVCRRRAPGASRAIMVGRTGVVVDEASVVRESEYFVAVDVERTARARGGEARVRIASAARREWLEEMFPAALGSSADLVFDAERERVVKRLRVCFFDLVLEERIELDVDRALAGALLAQLVAREPSRWLRPNAAAATLLRRLGFLHRAMPEIGLPAPQTLLSTAASFLCAGRVSLSEVRQLDLSAALAGLLSTQQRRALRVEAPVDYQLPSGRRAPIDYEADPPAVEARIQEIFGLDATPRLAGGRVPLVVRVLAPNYRPVQITEDLRSFWRVTYPKVRRQLRGRYPKHHWPEDPSAARATSEAGRRQPR